MLLGEEDLASPPCSARHCRTRRCRVRNTVPSKRCGYRSCSSSNTVTAISPGADSSIGTTSAVHTSVSGSARVRQLRAGFWDGSSTADSMRRALATLTPALAAATSWLCLPRSSLYLVT
jgi:hypothetical protein